MGVERPSLQKPHTNYIYLLPSTRISKVFYVNKSRVSYRHQNPSPLYLSRIYMKCSDGQYFEPPQVNIGDEAAETFLDKVLAAATICRQQHLAQ